MAEQRKKKPATEQFEALCYLLEDELERQGRILELCHAQGDAARCHDLELLEAKTATLLPLLQESTQAEALRIRLVGQIADATLLSNKRPSMSELILVAEEPWTSRLCAIQERFQESLAKTKNCVRDNSGVLRNALRVISHAMTALEQCASAGPAYTATGTEQTARTPQPSVIDRRG
jgi:hypothetical protein